MRLITTLLVLIFATSAYADDPALITGRITVFGSKIEVSPASLETPAGIPIFLNTTGKGLSGKLKGELRGPGINGALSFETDPGSPFQLPALQTKGTFFFEDIRLENNGQILASATPDRVEIRVIDVLITQITSRPLSLEEIRSLGIVINESDFTAVSFEVGLLFNSTPVKIEFPLLIPNRANLRPLIPVPPQQVWFAGQQLHPGAVSNMPGSIPSFAPVSFTASRPDFDGILPDIPGLLVFPNDIAFLNQFFAVVLMVTNGGSTGSSLTIEDLTAQMSFDPADVKLVKTNPIVPLGSPVPVRYPGLDGQIGTADDLDLIIAAQTGKSEFFIEGLQEGTHTVQMNLNATLHGLAQGDVPITGIATGAILVRNPNFSVTFSHPSIVRAFEPYDLFVTVTNTSTVDANLVRLSIPSNELVNCEILGDPFQDFETIRSAESGTAKFRINPKITGQVTTAVITSSGGVKGQFQLRVGVGEKGIPLSPNTLLLPEFANQLGPELLQKGLSVLGLAFSVATAPPGGLPLGVPYVSKSVVTQRAVEFAQAGQRFQLGEPKSAVLSHLLLDWLGNDSFDAGFVDLLHTTESGKAFVDEIFSQLNIGATNSISFHDSFAESTFFRDRYLSVMLSSSTAAAGLSIVDASGNFVGDRFTTTDGLAQWVLLAGLADPPSHILRITGSGGSSDLSILIPIGSSLYQAELNNLSTASGKYYEVVFNNTISNNELQLKDEQGTVTSIPLVPVQGLTPAVISAVQDAKADKTGHIIAVLFNQPVTENSAENISNYSVAGNRVVDAQLQRGGRIVYLSFLNPISPLIDNDLFVSGVEPTHGTGLVQGTTRIQTTATTEAAKVTGRFLASNGTPIPSAQVQLSEADVDDLFGERTEHVTAITSTNAQGEFSFDYVRKLSEPFKITAQDPVTGDIGSSSSTVTYANQLIRLDIVLLGRGTVKGKVFKKSGTSTLPVANAVVTAIALNEATTRQVPTDSAGNYLIDRVAVGTVNLSAQNLNTGDVEKFFGATTTAIPLAGSVVTADIEVTTTQPGSVKGRVLQSNGTDPIVGAYVLLSLFNTGSFADIADSQGWFQFDQVPPGAIFLEARDTATGRLIGRVNVTLVAGGSVVVNIVSSGSGTIEAIVSLATGMTLADVVVAVQGTQFSQRLSTSNSVLFPDIPVGGWTVLANNTKTGDSITSQAKLLYAGSTAVVSLRFPEKGTLRGEIKTVDGQPAPNSTVLLFGGVFAELLMGVTTADSSGHYLFKDLAFGKYKVHAIAANQNDGGAGAELFISTSNRNAVSNVTFLGKGTITVHVETSAGPVMTPVTLNTTTFNFDGRITRSITYTKTSDPTTGNAVFSDIFRLPFTAGASTPLTLPAHVSGKLTGPSTTVNILLTPNPNISGVVHDADGNPVQAQVTYSGGSGTQTLTTAPDGTFTFNGIALGRATFTASAGSTKGQLIRTIVAVNDPIDIHLLGFGSVHGMVKDADGMPVGGANLKLIVTGLLARTLQGISAPDGTYRFNSIPEGSIAIEANNTVQGTRAGTTIIHNADVPLDLILGPTGTVQGTVFHSDGVTRVVAAEVTLRYHLEIGIATTDGNGNFMFQYVPVSRSSGDQYQLTAFSKSTGRRASSALIVITSNNQIVNQNLILEGLGSLNGFVFDDTGINPISGSLLGLTSHGVVTQELNASSGAFGDFQFAGVPQGGYTLTARKDLLVGQVTGSITSDGEQKNQNVLLQPGAQIRGVIQFFDGTQIPAGVNPVVRISGPAVGLNVDAPDGNFFVSTLPYGDYRLTTNFTYANKAYRGISRITLSSPDETFVVLRLKGLNTLNVAVTGFVPNAPNSIKLTYTNDMEHRTESTGIPSDGTVQFINVPESKYTLMAKSGEFLTGSASGTFVGDGEIANVTLPLTASGTVQGTVYRNGVPAPDVSITLTGTAYTLFGYTDASGQFSIVGVPIGAYTLTAEDLFNGGEARVSDSIQFENDLNSHQLNLDTIKPVVISTDPAAGSTSVPNNNTIHVVFSEPMDPVSTGSAFSLTANDGKVSGTTTFTGTELTFVPSASLGSQKTYNIVVNASAEDVAGNPMGSDFVASFTSVDTSPPVLNTTVPLNLAFNVPLNTNLQLYFNETISDRGNYTITRSSGGSISVSNETWNAARTVLTLAFNSPFVESERITFVISGYSDTAGNVQSSSSTIVFDTIDTEPPPTPVLSSTDPDNKIREGTSVTILAAVAETLVNVDFFINGILRFHDTVGPYNYVIPGSLTTITTNGSNQLVVKASATDRSGNTSPQTSLTIELIPDTAPQITATTTPVPGNVTVGSTIRVNYNATDDGAITKVLIIATGAINQTIDAGASPSGSKDIVLPSTLSDGSSIFIEARATDNSGKSTSTSKFTFTARADNEDPNVTLTSPEGGHLEITEGQSFTVSANVTDNIRVDKVEFTFNSTTFADTSATYQSQFTAPSVTADTTFTGTVIGYDHVGNTTSVNFTVLVKPSFDPDKPTVQFLCPSDSALFPPNYNLNLSVQATDNQNVERVEFYRDAETTPFSTVANIALPSATANASNLLSGVSVGQNVSFTAIAYDYSGKTGQATIEIEIVDGTHITANTTVPNTPTNPYENATLIVESGATLTVNGPHTFADLVVLSGGTINHPDTAATEFKLSLTVNRVSIACGGSIDVSGRGYDSERTYPNTATGATTQGNSAGGYGGLGGSHLGSFVNNTYGSFVNPNESGSGGGSSFSGGGVVWIEAGSLIVDGSILANGNGDGLSIGPGSGGAIQIHTGAISGSGLITANGGPGDRSGGGGRVAVYYSADQMSGGLATHVQTRAGNGDINSAGATGGAGTIYLFNTTSSQYGDLLLNNTGVVNEPNSQPTLMPSIGSGTIVATNGNVITGSSAFPWSVIGLYVRVFNANGSVQGDYRIVNQSGATLTLEGLTADITGKSYRGVLKVDSLDVKSGAILKTEDLAELSNNTTMSGNGIIEAEVNALGDLTLSGSNTKQLVRPLHVSGNLSLQSGAVLAHRDTTTATEYKLEVHVGGTLSIDATSSIDVSGRGYDSERTYPNTATGATTQGNSAGGYGGLGGSFSGSFVNNTYGSFVNPNESGSGGGSSFSGGGVVWIEAGSLIVDGNILANGNGDGLSIGPGSGGAIQIHTGAISGSGSITANGGPGDRSGGGGRVAVYYSADQMSGGLATHVQTRAGNGDINSAGATGGAGTIYLFNTTSSQYGDLLLNNTGVVNEPNSQPTLMPSIGSGTIVATNGNVITGSSAFPWSVIGLYVRVFNTDGSVQGDYRIANQSGATLTLEGLTADITGKSYRGVLKVDSLDVKSGAILKTEDLVELSNNTTMSGNGIIEAEVNALGDLTLSGSNTKQLVRPLHVSGNLSLQSGAVLAHRDTTTATEYKLEVHVGGTLSIDATSSIDVSGRGYDSERTYPNTATGATTQGNSAGGYGGLGGSFSGSFVNNTYGSFVNPNESGSGGGSSFSGGGVVWIEAGSLIVDGNILANGNGDGLSIGPGSGGAIQIHTGAISGSGSITANGGPGDRSGGGGRVAVYYSADQMSGGLAAHVQTRAGNGDINSAGATGGAGTIYLFNTTSSQYGDLLLNNTGVVFPQNSQPTLIPSVGIGTVVSTNGNVITGSSAFPWSAIGLYVRVFNADGSVQGDYRIVNQSGATLTLEGLTADVTGKNYRGVLKVDSLDVKSSAILKTEDLVELSNNTMMSGNGIIEAEVNALGDLTLSGSNTKQLVRPLHVSGNLSLQSGAVLAHRDTTTATEYKLEVHVGGTLSIDATSSIDVSGRGYDSERTYPNTTTGATVQGNSAGGYGGLGGSHLGSFVNNTYGSFVNPNESGSGGGSSFSGGGVVWIEAGSLIVDGNILANGNGDGLSIGPGSGGAIQIHTGAISGSGSITANGGPGDRSGGGGRVAVYYSADQMSGGLATHVQTRAGNGDINSAGATGGAGTIYLFNTSISSPQFGNLIADNSGVVNPLNSSATKVPGVGAGSITQIVQDPVDLTLWSIQTDQAAGFPFSLEGAYIVFHGAFGDSPLYRIVGTSGANNKLLYFRVATTQPSPAGLGVQAGNTYSGAYQLDSITAKGGARIVFADPLYCPNITETDSGSNVQAPNLP